MKKLPSRWCFYFVCILGAAVGDLVMPHIWKCQYCKDVLEDKKEYDAHQKHFHCWSPSPGPLHKVISNHCSLFRSLSVQSGWLWRSLALPEGPRKTQRSSTWPVAFLSYQSTRFHGSDKIFLSSAKNLVQFFCEQTFQKLFQTDQVLLNYQFAQIAFQIV